MSELTWFLRCIEHPPTDPLTIQLLHLVEDLPQVPGPKTIGPDKYAEVSKAFLDRGWAGFEEAFDKIVPRSRPDYAEVKRELLREPIFSPKVHMRMTRIFLGEATVEETLEEIAKERKSRSAE